MLLALRSLWEAAVETFGGGKRRKIPLRKPPRAARWSEYFGLPPREEIVVVTDGIAAAPRIGFATLSIGYPLRLSGVAAKPKLGRARASAAVHSGFIAANPEIGETAIEAGIDLFDYEIAALLA